MTPSTLHMASVTAGLICERMGWPTGASATNLKPFNGVRKLVLEMFHTAKAEGKLETVYVNLNGHIVNDMEIRVRQTVGMLIAGQSRNVLECSL